MTRFGGPPEQSEGGESHRMVGPLRALLEKKKCSRDRKYLVWKRGLYTGLRLLEIPGRNHLESTRILPDSYQESPGPGPSQIIRFSANLMISIPTRFPPDSLQINQEYQ